MKRFFVTGVSGVGKSTVGEKLSQKGISVIDIDGVEGLCRWINQDTSKVVDWHPGMPSEWFKKHKYICDKERLISLMNDRKDKNVVVVVGLPSNRSKLWELFDEVFLLHCKEETFIKRMIERTSHNFGKDVAEQESILSWYKDFEKGMLDKGAIAIDAEEPIDDVVEKIIKIIKS